MCEPERFQQTLNQLRELYQPANVQEEYYLTQIAEGQLNMHRLGQLQAGLYNRFIQLALDEEFSEVEAFPIPMYVETPFSREQRQGVALAYSFTQYALKGNVLAFFSRFIADAKRNLRRDQEQFDQIRKQQLKPPPKPKPEAPEVPPDSQEPKVHLLTKTGKPLTTKLPSPAGRAFASKGLPPRPAPRPPLSIATTRIPLRGSRNRDPSPRHSPRVIQSHRNAVSGARFRSINSRSESYP